MMDERKERKASIKATGKCVMFARYSILRSCFTFCAARFVSAFCIHV